MIVDTIYLHRHRLDLDEMVDIALAKSRKRLITMALLMGVVAGLATYVLTTPGDPDPFRMLVSFGGFAAVTLITFLSSRSNFKKFYQKPGQENFRGDRTVILNDDGIKIDYISGISTFLPWRTLQKADWGKSLLLLYMTDSQFLMIPRRIMDRKTEDRVRESLERAKTENAIEEGRLPTT